MCRYSRGCWTGGCYDHVICVDDGLIRVAPRRLRCLDVNKQTNKRVEHLFEGVHRLLFTLYSISFSCTLPISYYVSVLPSPRSLVVPTLPTPHLVCQHTTLELIIAPSSSTLARRKNNNHERLDSTLHASTRRPRQSFPTETSDTRSFSNSTQGSLFPATTTTTTTTTIPRHGIPTDLDQHGRHVVRYAFPHPRL